MTPEDEQKSNTIRNMLSSCLKSLGKSEYRLLTMYWAAGMSPGEILTYIDNEKELDDFEDSQFTDDKSVYNQIDKIISKLLKWIRGNHEAIYKDYELTLPALKRAVKVYLENFSE